MAKPKDARNAVYHQLHHRQLEADDKAAEASARRILSLLFAYLRPRSVLDVGCGLGTWLAVARGLGVAEIAGLEGPWLDRKQLRIEADLVTTVDLERPFDRGRRYDLVICLEVAEHISGKQADRFVDSLTRHAELILFSAAVPLQGGDHHVNEQWPPYWIAKFERRDYVAIDFIRSQIWADPSILRWLRQNVFVYASRRLVAAMPSLSALVQLRTGAMPVSVVHPETFEARLGFTNGVIATQKKAIAECQQIMKMLASGKTFKVGRDAAGNVTFTRLS